MKNKSCSENPFGPQLSKLKPIEASKKIKKLIHYDCNNFGIEDDDIPAEDEIYIKENLLNKKGAETITDPGDDLSIVNINVSVLYSSSGDNSNSKNSVTLTYSPDSKKKNSASISKLSKNSNKNSSGNNTNIYQSNTVITNNSNKSNSNKSSTKSDTRQIREIINKRKNLIQKVNINKTKKDSKDKEMTHNTIFMEEVQDTVPEMTSFGQKNVKITNITNIILGGKSFDMKTPGNDTMLRDIKALHLITQKALSTQSKLNPTDSIDDERRSFVNFHNKNSKKALFIDDNSEFPSGTGPDLSNSKEYTDGNNRNQIINIININNNYNIGSLNMTNITNKNTIFNTGSSSQQTKKSFRSINISNYKKNFANVQSSINNTSLLNNHETPLESGRSIISGKTDKKMIPKYNQASNSKTIKDIIKSVKSNDKGVKEKFIKLSNTLHK